MAMSGIVTNMATTYIVPFRIIKRVLLKRSAGYGCRKELVAFRTILIADHDPVMVGFVIFPIRDLCLVIIPIGM